MMKSCLTKFQYSALLLFVVVEGFPKADPDVEQTQAPAQSTKEAGRNEGTKPGKREQQIVVGPLGGPGQDHEQHPGDRADQNEKKDGGAVHPELQTAVGRSGNPGLRPGLAGRGWTGFNRQLGVAHRALRCSGAGITRRWKNGPRCAGKKV